MIGIILFGGTGSIGKQTLEIINIKNTSFLLLHLIIIFLLQNK